MSAAPAEAKPECRRRTDPASATPRLRSLAAVPTAPL